MTDDTAFDAFLGDNYRLFAVRGAFGTVALYLTRVVDDVPPDRQATVRLGVLASLLLFAFTAAYVNRRVFERFGSVGAALRALTARRGVAYVLFLVPFDVLVATVVLTALDFPPAIPLLGGFLAFVVGYVGYNEAAGALLGRTGDPPASDGTDPSVGEPTDRETGAGGAGDSPGRFALTTVAISAPSAAGATLALRRLPAVAVGAWFPPGTADASMVAALAGPFLAGLALSAGVTAAAALALAVVVLGSRPPG